MHRWGCARHRAPVGTPGPYLKQRAALAAAINRGVVAALGAGKVRQALALRGICGMRCQDREHAPPRRRPRYVEDAHRHRERGRGHAGLCAGAAKCLNSRRKGRVVGGDADEGVCKCPACIGGRERVMRYQLQAPSTALRHLNDSHKQLRLATTLHSLVPTRRPLPAETLTSHA